ncbi:hypothetical protein U1Q18_037381 [Sarracenia purpurea var. burkii]
MLEESTPWAMFEGVGTYQAGSLSVDAYAKCGEIFNLLPFEIACPKSNSSKIDDLRTRKATQISNPCCSLSKKAEDLLLSALQSQVKNQRLGPCLKELGLTRQAHCQVLIAGFLSNVVLSSSVVDAYAKCGEIFNLLPFEIACPKSNSSKIDDLRTRKATQISNPCCSLSKKAEDLLLSAHQEEYDIHDPNGHCSLVLPFLMETTEVIAIVAVHGIVFSLAHSGVCAAFSRESNKRICFLNVSRDEVIRILFYNKNDDSLITVSLCALDNFRSLKCRSTRIKYVPRGKPDTGFPLFESESLARPGFVRFDDVNGKVLTRHKICISSAPCISSINAP